LLPMLPRIPRLLFRLHQTTPDYQATPAGRGLEVLLLNTKDPPAPLPPILSAATGHSIHYPCSVVSRRLTYLSAAAPSCSLFPPPPLPPPPPLHLHNPHPLLYSSVSFFLLLCCPLQALLLSFTYTTSLALLRQGRGSHVFSI
jgi:hypothetical protein